MKCSEPNCFKEAKHRGLCVACYNRKRRSGELKVLPTSSGNKCAVDGCDRLVGREGGFGYCSKHYQRYKKHGNTHTVFWKKLKGETFEEKLKLNSVEDERGCWIWQGSKTRSGYGSISIGGTKTMLTHRLAYKLWKGELSDDFFVCHHCDTPLCVNPDHLFLGTNQDNIDDKMFKGRAYTGVHKGEKNENSCLTERQVKRIKYYLKHSSTSQAELSRVFGVSRTTIYSIANNKTWTHIATPDKLSRRRRKN